MTYPGKGRADYLALGDWNVVCYECGRKRKASTMKKYWQGYWVCPEHWEPRQPQDFVRAVPDVQTPPWVQPMPADTFVAICTPEGASSVSDFAVSDCVTVGYIWPQLYYDYPASTTTYFLQEDGVSRFTLEDSTGFLILE